MRWWWGGIGSWAAVCGAWAGHKYKGGTTQQDRWFHPVRRYIGRCRWLGRNSIERMLGEKKTSQQFALYGCATARDPRLSFCMVCRRFCSDAVHVVIWGDETVPCGCVETATIPAVWPQRGGFGVADRGVSRVLPRISPRCGGFRALDIAISLICGTCHAICRARSLEFQRPYSVYPGFGATDKRDSRTEDLRSATDKRDRGRLAVSCCVSRLVPAVVVSRRSFDAVLGFRRRSGMNPNVLTKVGRQPRVSWN